MRRQHSSLHGRLQQSRVPVIRGIEKRGLPWIVTVSVLIALVGPSAKAQSLQFPLPGLGGALQSSLKKATANATAFAGELAGSIAEPTTEQLAAVAQFSNFVAQLSSVDLGNPSAVAAAAKLGARAGQCLVLQVGTPTASKVAKSLETGMSPRQANTYLAVSQQIARANGALSSPRPCDP